MKSFTNDLIAGGGGFNFGDFARNFLTSLDGTMLSSLQENLNQELNAQVIGLESIISNVRLQTLISAYSKYLYYRHIATLVFNLSAESNEFELNARELIEAYRNKEKVNKKLIFPQIDTDALTDEKYSELYIFIKKILWEPIEFKIDGFNLKNNIIELLCEKASISAEAFFQNLVILKNKAAYLKDVSDICVNLDKPKKDSDVVMEFLAAIELPGFVSSQQLAMQCMNLIANNKITMKLFLDELKTPFGLKETPALIEWRLAQSIIAKVSAAGDHPDLKNIFSEIPILVVPPLSGRELTRSKSEQHSPRMFSQPIVTRGRAQTMENVFVQVTQSVKRDRAGSR